MEQIKGLYLLFLLFINKRCHAVTEEMLALFYLPPGFAVLPLAKRRVFGDLLFYKPHHCPAVVLGIVKVAQAVACSLFLEYLHVIGVEAADEEL